jgi:two-component system, LytTR family, response regulator
MKAIIIDDENKARQLLKLLLAENCPQINVVEECADVAAGVRAIKKHQPELIFLDIEMPGINGLQILDFFNEDEINFSIIFVTAYNDYALQAFKLSAVDYILKPINTDLLVEAVTRFENTNNRKLRQLEALKQNLSNSEDKKIVIPNIDNLHYVSPADIMYVKGEGAYATFYLQNGEKYMLSRNLKYVEEMLANYPYLRRCQKSYIVNIKEIKSFSKQDYLVTLNSGIQIPISVDRVSEIMP